MTDARALTDELGSLTLTSDRLAERIEVGLTGNSGWGRQAAAFEGKLKDHNKPTEAARELPAIWRQDR